MSRGRRLLIAVLQRTTATELAARCGVAPSCVSRWVGGLCAPSDEPRARLCSIYGIPGSAWERPAVSIYSVRHAPPKNGFARARQIHRALSCPWADSETRQQHC